MYKECASYMFGANWTLYLQIKQGVDVVKRVEGVGSNSGSTSKTVKIADSGELKE